MNIEINNGAVTKDGELIGTIQDGTCHLTKEIGPTVKAAINTEHGDKLKFVVAPLSPQDGPEGSDGPPSPAGEVLTASVECAEPMPERDPVRGDKCPKLIAWKAKQKGGE